MTSIALSGSLRSLMYFAASSAADSSAVVVEADLVVLLVALAQALEDLDRLFDRGLVDVDLLEAPRQRAVAVERRLVVGVGGRADAAQLARLRARA